VRAARHRQQRTPSAVDAYVVVLSNSEVTDAAGVGQAMLPPVT
jgi:hypothetical protein